MILSNRQVQHMQRTTENLAKIRVGDKVKIVNCFEAERCKEQVFEVLSEPYKIGGTWCIKIEQEGTFDIACLEKVSS